MDTATEIDLTPEQSAAVKRADKLYNYICASDPAKPMVIPPDSADQIIRIVKGWIDDSSFTRSGFEVRFSDDYAKLYVQKRLREVVI